MTRRTLLAGSLLAVSATGRATAEDARVNVDDGNPHGDPPFLLEKGWTRLLNGRDLSGWSYERPEKAGWTTSPGIYWDGQRAPKALIALRGHGSRIANGPMGGIRIYTRNSDLGMSNSISNF